MAKGRAAAITLVELEKRELTTLTRKHGAPQSLADRARIILAAAAVSLNLWVYALVQTGHAP
jgi:hypothetical protein